MARSVRPAGGFEGFRLLQARERLGLTRAELARRLDTGWDVVLQWETGQSRPRPRSVPAIAAAVGVAVPDLCSRRQGAASLAELRIAAGLNQADVAEILGVNRAAVSQWERGSRPVPAKHRGAYRRLLGLADGDETSSDALAGEQEGQRRANSTTEAGSETFDPREAESSGLLDRTSDSAARGVAARVAHLIVISDLEFSHGEFVGGDHPKNWRVYSPQGADVDKTSLPDLELLMEDTAIRLAKLGYRQLCLHSEQRVIIDDEPVRVVRVQTSPPSDARMHISRVFLALFTPEFYFKGIGEDLEEKSVLRKQFERDFPQLMTGETLFVVAESTDTYGWLQDQTLPYTPYTIVSYLPESDRHFFAPIYHDHTGVETEAGFVSLDDLGVQRDTTVGEIAARLDQHFRLQG
ncbi:helix-turn-helix transcriptional regulator [Mycolicibacterium septicum]|nr:helix-turn-helix transcriptional regulator [Mycolicibacterium septicum]